MTPPIGAFGGGVMLMVMLLAVLLALALREATLLLLLVLVRAGSWRFLFSHTIVKVR